MNSTLSSFFFQFSVDFHLSSRPSAWMDVISKKQIKNGGISLFPTPHPHTRRIKPCLRDDDPYNPHVENSRPNMVRTFSSRRLSTMSIAQSVTTKYPCWKEGKDDKVTQKDKLNIKWG